MEDNSQKLNTEEANKETSSNKNSKVKALVIGLFAAFLIVGGVYGFLFFNSPVNFRSPKLEHAHLRMQYVVDGTAIDFSDDKFQQEYKKGVCSAEFPKQPIHFHDNLDQFVHLHWKDVTGAQLLGYYGNSVGGVDGTLGYKQNSLTDWEKVPAHGDLLDNTLKDSMWVYAATDSGLELRDIDAFLNDDLETFFGDQSSFNPPETSFLNRFFPVAHAQEDLPDESDLKRIQNLIGDVVIFIQDTEPTAEQIESARINFIELENSVCGG
ncbi:TPA: hypothetical protein EYO12_00635 [Candidatus Saccharibacteria bacterium]|nr:hypothetical protein [Candidatus Saccharibacteria bacterium]HIO87601.1 hypothetical protein [Candidatus Saccharibacteria bacterium]